MNRDDLPPIPWHEANDGVTHAFWSEHYKAYFFWKIDNDITYYEGPHHTLWVPHKNQNLAREKLKKLLRDKLIVAYDEDHDTHDTEQGTTTMNLNNAALLVRDDITTVNVQLAEGEKAFTYILHNTISAAPGDTVVVPIRNSLETATVLEVHETPQVDPSSQTKYRWVVANVTEALVTADKWSAETKTIAGKLKDRQRTNVREQILAQFGITSAQELLPNNPQSE